MRDGCISTQGGMSCVSTLPSRRQSKHHSFGVCLGRFDLVKNAIACSDGNLNSGIVASFGSRDTEDSGPEADNGRLHLGLCVIELLAMVVEELETGCLLRLPFNSSLALPSAGFQTHIAR